MKRCQALWDGEIVTELLRFSVIVCVDDLQLCGIVWVVERGIGGSWSSTPTGGHPGNGETKDDDYETRH